MTRTQKTDKPYERIRNISRMTFPFMDEEDFKSKRKLAELALEKSEEERQSHPSTSWLMADPYLGKGDKAARKKRFLGTLPTVKHDRFKPGKPGFFMGHSNSIRATVEDMYDVNIAHSDKDGVIGGWKLGNGAEMARTHQHRAHILLGGVRAAKAEGGQVKKVLGVEFPRLEVRGLLQAMADNTEYGDGFGGNLEAAPTPPPAPAARVRAWLARN